MFKFSHQLESNDCGIACIKMIINYYGKKIPYSKLINSCENSRLGLTINDIIHVLNSEGIDALCIKTNISNLYSTPLPVILYWKSNHYVVLYRIKKKTNKFIIADPASGKQTLSEEDVNNKWEKDEYARGIAILTEPSTSFTKVSPDKDNRLKKLSEYLISLFKALKHKLLAILLLSILLTFTEASIPFLLKNTIDQGIQEKNISLIWYLISAQLALAIGYIVGTSIVQILISRASYSISAHTLNNFFQKLINKSISYFDSKIISNFIQKIDDQERLNAFLVSFPQNILITTLTLAIYTIILFIFSKTAFLVFLFMSVFDISWNLIFLKKKAFLDSEKFQLSSKNRNHIYEIINGIVDLKINNGEKSKISKWKFNFIDYNNISLKTLTIDMWQKGGSQVIDKLKDLIITGMCATFVVYGDITIGTMLTIAYFSGRLSMPFQMVISQISILQYSILSYERIMDIYDNTPTKKLSCPNVYDTLNNFMISFKDVSFKYSGSHSPYVLKNLTFDIPNGSTVALVGESGSGKSTLIKLMLGFYTVSSGSIYFGSRKHKQIDKSQWLKECSAVLQEGYIFSATVAENVALSDVEPDMERLNKAIFTVGLSDFIASLPFGINTNLGSSGVTLSGGQKQRLLIARALYKDSPILFMDEATSSLDANNEARILNAIKKMKGEKTIIIAAHRLSTIKDADIIMFLRNGEIAEMGNHESLIAMNGAYKDLVSKQMILKEDQFELLNVNK